MNLEPLLEEINLEVSLNQATGEGTSDHNLLINRNMNNQHPISAITSLSDTLNTIPSLFIQNIEWDETDGIITVTYQDGSTLEIDIAVAKLGLELSFDSSTNELVITNSDGTETRISLADLVPIYNGSMGTNIQISIDSSNNINATLLTGTVTLAHLDTNTNAIISGKADTTWVQEELDDLENAFVTTIGNLNTSLQSALNNVSGGA